jgi:signal peptidase I
VAVNRIQLLREWLGSGEPAWLHLTGDSMRPFLPAGVRLLVCGVAPNRIGRGDLIVFEAEDTLVCHRVLCRRVRRGARGFLTRGDAWRTPQAWIAEAHVVGNVVAVAARRGVVAIDTPQRRLQATALAALSQTAGTALAALRRARGFLARAPRWMSAA